MSTIKVRDEETGKFKDISIIQGPKGDQGEQGPQGPKGDTGAAGISVNVVKATSESDAITKSQQNPNNIYYWTE